MRIFTRGVLIFIGIIVCSLFLVACGSNKSTKGDSVVQQLKSEISIPREHRNALKKAQMYSDMMYMSKRGVYEQLTSEYGEKFSHEAAQYAVDNVRADWNKNALKKARMYSDTMSMSKSGIYDQLVSDYGEKFTSSQAQYAVDNL